MPQDRSLLALLRETLTEKKVKRFFPNPADPTDPKGNETRLSELLDTALWWMAEQEPIELEGSYTIPSNGVLSLGSESTSKLRKLVAVQQNGEFYEQAKVDWSEGVPQVRGSWLVHKRTFYALGIYTGSLAFLKLSRSAHPFNELGLFVERQLVPGAVTFYYYGIPVEADIIDVGKYRRAVIDYAMHLAYDDILGKALQDKMLKMPGIPEIHINEREIRSQSKARLESAMRALGKTYTASS